MVYLIKYKKVITLLYLDIQIVMKLNFLEILICILQKVKLQKKIQKLLHNLIKTS